MGIVRKMTIVAYRNGVMASDSLMTNGGTRSAFMQKLFRIDDCLIGVSGECAPVMRFIEQFDLDKMSKLSNIVTGMYALIVKGRKVYMYDDGSMIPIDPATQYVAIGSGAPFALGAMAIGAGPVRAVRAAIKHDIQCGGKIQIEELKY